MREHFCTCKSESCKLHPRLHEEGCDPCVRKNLSRGEVPACFFRDVHDDLAGLEVYTYESFVRHYIRHHGVPEGD